MRIIQFLLIILISFVLLESCYPRKQRLDGFALQNVGEKDADTTVKPIYITGTLPVDSADPKKLIYDIWRVDFKKYPDSLKFYARVFDSAGKFITNMGDPYKKFPEINYFSQLNETLGKHYKQREKDVPEFTVREFGAGDSIPYAIALSIDYSGSMDAVKSVLQEGTEIFIGLKFPYDYLAISTYNAGFDLKVPLSKDTNYILAQWKANKNSNFGLFSAVYDAMASCLRVLKDASKEGPRVMVIFSDGDDNYSQTKVGSIIEEAINEEIVVFTIAFGYSIDENLKHIAKYTGGKFYKARTKEELIDIFRDIYMSLRFYYLVTYKPPTYWGYHKINSFLDVPDADSVKVAHADYDTSDLFPWDSLNKAFSRPILFEFDSARVLDESLYIIDEIVDAMMSKPTIRLEIQGHTDGKGSEEYNLTLSERRAKAVYDLLIVGGIEERRLRWRGFGLTRPLASNETDEGRAKNRRTEFVIIAK